MKTLFKKKLISAFLLVAIFFTMLSITQIKVFALTSEFSIQSDNMIVRLDPSFPRVIDYTVNGSVMYGQEDEIKTIIINGKNYTPQVLSEKVSDTKVNYTLTVSEINVVIKLSFTVTNNVLELRYTDIIDNTSNEVFAFEIPYQSLVSVRSTQSGSNIAYTKDYLNNDVITSVGNASIDSQPKQVGYAILSTDKLSATIETSLGAYYYKLQTVQKSGYKKVGLWSDYYQCKGPISNLEERKMELPWTKVTVVGDQNGDNIITWQDGAIAYRTIMDEIPGQGNEFAKKTSLVNIICSYFGRLPWTWDIAYDYMQRQSLATDNFPQAVEIKAAHDRIDGDPSYGNGNKLLGGNEKLNWFMTAVKNDFNGLAGAHTSQHEAYPESTLWEGTPVTNRRGWDEIDREGVDIDQLKYWNTGLLGQRYDLNASNWPNNKFLYVDIEIAGTGNDNERKFMVYKIVSKFKEHNWNMLTEYSYPVGIENEQVDLGAKYLTWVHTSTSSGNSNIKRFIMNSNTLLGVGTQEYQQVLGRGYGDYGYLGWWGCGTIDNTVNNFWEYTLTDTYLRNFELLKVFKDDQNNNQMTALFSNGVKSVFDGQYQNIYKDGILYARVGGPNKELFVPYEPKCEEKIYTCKDGGGEKSWTLPQSWSGINNVYLYKLDEILGRIYVKTLPVINSKITVNYEDGKGYVITKAQDMPKKIVWGKNSLIKDMEFNSNSFDYWKPQNDNSTISFQRDNSNSNYYLKIAGTNENSVSQSVTGLVPGKEYTLTLQSRVDSGKKAKLQIVDGTNELFSSVSTDYNVTVKTDRLNDWMFMYAHFKAPANGTVLVKLTGLSNQSGGFVCFDDLRLVMEDNPYGKDGHYYYEDFETTHLSGPLVHENQGINVTATLTNKNEPYTKDVISGEKSLKVMNSSKNRNLKTLPSTLKLMPNKTYTLSYKYKPMYNPATGWKCVVYSQKANKVLAKKDLNASAWSVSRDTLTFKTDDKDDYRIEFWYSGLLGGDIVLDDLTVDEGEHVQGIPFNTAFPNDGGTVVVYSHQDDDLIWMLPIWEKANKFVDGAMPTTPTLKNVVKRQQEYINKTKYSSTINYLQKWETPFGEITDQQYHDYYWYNKQEANPGDGFLKSKWDDNDVAQTTAEVDKIKNKIRPYFIDPNNKRFVTHNIWGEYGHQHHKALNRAVRELAVEYCKDVYMLGNTASYDGIGSEKPIPEQVKYTTGTYDPDLFKACKQAYLDYKILNYPTWTWGNFVPNSTYKYPLIVDQGVDMEPFYNGKIVDPEEIKPDENGIYKFFGANKIELSGTKSAVFTATISIQPQDWVNEPSSTMYIGALAQKNDLLIEDRDLYLNSNRKLVARIWDNVEKKEKLLVSSMVIPTDKWTNIVFTGDGTNLYLYINGVLDCTLKGCAYTGYKSDTAYYVGRVAKKYYKGLAKDIGYSQVFTTQEKAIEIYNNSLKPKTYIFDGIDNTVTFNGIKSNVYSISMSVNPNKLSSMGIFTTELESDKMVQDRELRMSPDGTMKFMVFDSATNLKKVITANAKLKQGEWTHIILTCDGKKVSVYVNGELDCEIDGESFVKYDNNVLLRLGWIYNASYFEGKITNVAMSDKYTDSQSAKAQYLASIAGPSLKSIQITSNPAKLKYKTGDALDLTGMVISAVYSDDSEQTISNEDCNIIGFDNQKVGQQTITVLYYGKTTTFVLDVVKNYIFDGVDDTVALKSTKSKIFGVIMSIKPNRLASMGVYTTEQVNDNQIQDRELRIRADGTMQFMVYDGAVKSEKAFVANSKLKAGEWTNIILTGDGAKVSVYVNGVLDCEINGEAYEQYAKDVILRLGKIYNAPYFSGEITDVEVVDQYITYEMAQLKYLNSFAYKL